ncbi:MAG: 5-formyltetrahydrofolate cyclo-ligase, partial [Stenotrophobium sp.]
MRRELRRRRADIPPATARSAALSAAIHLLRNRWLRQARHVAIYHGYGNELCTTPLLEMLLDSGRHVYVPRVVGEGRMRFYELRRGTALRRNRYGIAEPASHARRRGPRRMDLIVLPLLGFDAQGRRLGSGGGYYDRALAFPRAFRRPRFIGYAYAAQEVDDIPIEAWDIRL